MINTVIKPRASMDPAQEKIAKSMCYVTQGSSHVDASASSPIKMPTPMFGISAIDREIQTYLQGDENVSESPVAPRVQDPFGRLNSSSDAAVSKAASNDEILRPKPGESIFGKPLETGLGSTPDAVAAPTAACNDEAPSVTQRESIFGRPAGSGVSNTSDAVAAPIVYGAGNRPSNSPFADPDPGSKAMPPTVSTGETGAAGQADQSSSPFGPSATACLESRDLQETTGQSSCNPATQSSPPKAVSSDMNAAAAQQAADPSTSPPSAPKPKPSGKHTVLDDLQAISATSRLDELKDMQRDTTFVAGRLAKAGQITVFFAAPNTGKTLLSLHLISEALHTSATNLRIFHLNMDDSLDGVVQKAEIGLLNGFEVVGSDNFPCPAKNFEEVVGRAIEDGVAGESVFILDTIKHFTNVMDKKASSAFMRVCRRLTSHGGTVILLAHTNKNKNAEGESVPGGTNDLREDADCAYVLELLKEEVVPGGTKRTVEFRQIKVRGPSVKTAMYSYVHNDAGDYLQLFRSVEQMEGNDADRAREQAARDRQLRESQDMINAINTLLSGKPAGMNQREIVSTLTQSHGYSRRKLTGCLHMWSAASDANRIWDAAVGSNNSRVYSLVS